MRPIPIPATHSALDPAALAGRVLAGYDLPGPHPPRCRLAHQALNDTYRVEAGDAVFYLRVSRAGWRRAADVEAELDALACFADRGIAVVRPVARPDGARVVPLEAPEGERQAVLFRAVAGDDARQITPAQARAYGRLAGRLHAAADAAGDAFPRAPRRLDVAHLIDEPLAVIRAAMGHHEAAFGELDAVAARVRTRLAALPWTIPAVGFCHGDLHPGNVRFGAGGEPAIFDFDCWGEGWRAYDLAVFLWNSSLERRPKAWRRQRWNAFLKGYRAERPIGDDELASVPLFLVARHVWLLGLDCAGQTDYRPQWLTEGWLREVNGFVAAWVEEYPILR